MRVRVLIGCLLLWLRMSPARAEPTPAEPRPGPPAAPSSSSAAGGTGASTTPPESPDATEKSLGLYGEEWKHQTVFAREEEKLLDLRTSMLFLERTHFAVLPLRIPGQHNNAYGNDVAPLLFEGIPALHIPINNRLSELLAYDARAGYANTIPYLSLSFIPTVRMSLGTLNVLTPSYRVRGNLQWFWQRSHFGGHADHVMVRGLRASFTHYSNGQGDCSFLVGARDASPKRSDPPSACRLTYDSAQAGQSSLWYRQHANLNAGSFSTNYVTVAYHQRRVWLEGAPHDRDGLRRETRSVTGGLIANALIAAWNGEGQKNLYPRFNVRAELRVEQIARWSRYPARLSAEVFGEYYFLDQKRRWSSVAYPSTRGGIELSVTWPKANDLGLYVSVSGGQDPYNIQFMQSSTWIQVLGLVVDLFPRPRYGSGRLKYLERG